ncbi:MAG: ABC transporter permease [Candidatus Bipolaricaulaceae bacterium]
MTRPLRIGSRSLRAFLRNRVAVVGAVLAVGVILLALAAPAVAPYDPLEQNVYVKLQTPSGAHPFGTDDFGRDVLSRVFFGARVSLTVGVLSVLMGMAVGTLMGLVAGYLRGWLEQAIMRLVDVLMAFPVLIMGLLVMATLGTGLGKMIAAIGVVLAPRFARLAYGAVVAIREQDYVDAARAVGGSPWRIMLRHVLPNVFGEILVMGTLWTATAIRIEANLSFIGLGVSPPTPTWGNMIREGVNWIVVAPWLPVFPGLAILVTVLAFNMVGDGLRDAVDPKLQT